MSTKVLTWILGILAALVATGVAAVFNFYIEWSNDEAAEDVEKVNEKALMFDTPEQKEEHKDYIKEAIPVLDQKMKNETDKIFQKQMLETAKRQDCLLIRLNDQYYQLKQDFEGRSPQ